MAKPAWAKLRTPLVVKIWLIPTASRAATPPTAIPLMKAETVVAGGHPVVDVGGEQVEPVAVLPLGQQCRLVVEELLDLVLQLDVHPGDGRLVPGHGFEVEGHRLTPRAAMRFSLAASISDQLSQVIMSIQHWYMPRAAVSA